MLKKREPVLSDSCHLGTLGEEARWKWAPTASLPHNHKGEILDLVKPTRVLPLTLKTNEPGSTSTKLCLLSMPTAPLGTCPGLQAALEHQDQAEQWPPEPGRSLGHQEQLQGTAPGTLLGSARA